MNKYIFILVVLVITNFCYSQCADDEVADCDESGECCTAGWFGDGFPDCNDQQYGADLCCYDLDGGDCTEEQCDDDDSTDTGGTTGGTTGGSSDCDSCEFDWTAYGSECCDTAWTEFGIDCATLAANYNWDCAGCDCPGDLPPECGDGSCNGDETYETCPEDCNAPGECDAGYIIECADEDCCPETRYDEQNYEIH